MRTRWCVLACAVMLAAGLNGLAAAQIFSRTPPSRSTATIDPMLQSMLQTASPWQPIEAVLTFDHAPTATDLQVVTATGLDVISFRMLPMLGVRGTSTQILALFGLAGLRSAYGNRQLDYFLNQSVPLIGADRVWNELGITGKG